MAHMVHLACIKELFYGTHKTYLAGSTIGKSMEHLDLKGKLVI